MSFKIETIYAFISVVENHDEGVIAFNANGTMMPLVCGDEERLKSIRPLAEKIAELNPHIKVKLVKFTSREDLETL